MIAEKLNQFTPFLPVFFFHLIIIILSPARTENCDKTSSSSHFFSCDQDGHQQNYCKTYAILEANNTLGSYLNIPRSELAEANNFSPDRKFFAGDDRQILIPLDCRCNEKARVFEAEVKKATVEGESFFEIAESLKGLTTCGAIKERNPGFSPSEKSNNLLVIPLKCACPNYSSAESQDSSVVLLSYPVKEGDTLFHLSSTFNLSQEIIISTHTKYSKSVHKPESGILSPFSTLLLPVENKTLPNPRLIPTQHVGDKYSDKRERHTHKMKIIGIYIAIALSALLACASIFAAVFFLHIRKRKSDEPTIKNSDPELRRLGLSVRTTSDKKISFESSQYNFDDTTTTPHKMAPFETYALEDLHRATEGFSLSNLIGGSVFHGRLKGKNLAIKRVGSDLINEIERHVLDERPHQHPPNTIRLLGTCPVAGGRDSFVVLEYAKNGSVKDWIHGGLAIKSHFIESCSCFLTWNQRLRICLDVATALQYMHHVMNPSYVHGSIRSRNIFLDGEFGAKVGNPGMSRCIESKAEAEDEETLSQEKIWEKGYLAPECLSKGTILPGVDVFAYGVILLEVLSGKPPVRRDGEGKDGILLKLSDEIKHVLGSDGGKDELRGWVDGAFGENYSFDAAFMLAGLAKSCVEDDVALRPNAGEIVEKLLRVVEDLPEGDGFGACDSSCSPLVKAGGRQI
ncbi:Protein LYK2 [Striga hermonthica]|uniref:Protein LYK2 n=1 Tax=Striga hermonthica TaxID=68872 RepID=A0A9N7N5I3_STRHE|nr:Protein LYK2 [Striga hermonthica]